MTSCGFLGVPVFVLVSYAACDSSRESPATAAETKIWERSQSDEALEHGRQIWAANCKRCHAHGVQGAPPIGDKESWSPRVSKAVPDLVQSVVNGVQGKAGGEMPPRAGNEALTDSEIAAAVRYMVAMSK